MKRILIACEFSGTVREAFKAKGWDAWSCDLLPTEIPGQHIQGDVLEVLKDNWDMIIAHPPCTDLAVSGAAWFEQKRKDGRQQKSIEFFMKFTNAKCPMIAIENPIGIMSTIHRKPDQIIQPWQYGHSETKATCLWLKGLPVLKPTNIVELPKERNKRMRLHYLPPSKDRWKLRSLTYPGIAKAMAEQWGLTAPAQNDLKEN